MVCLRQTNLCRMGNYKIYIKEKVLKIYAAQTVYCALVDIQFFCGICQKKRNERQTYLVFFFFLRNIFLNICCQKLYIHWWYIYILMMFRQSSLNGPPPPPSNYAIFPNQPYQMPKVISPPPISPLNFFISFLLAKFEISLSVYLLLIGN